jgi:hypothetical protein
VAISYRRFKTTRKSVKNYRHTLRKNPEKRYSQDLTGLNPNNQAGNIPVLLGYIFLFFWLSDVSR